MLHEYFWLKQSTTSYVVNPSQTSGDVKEEKPQVLPRYSVTSCVALVILGETKNLFFFYVQLSSLLFFFVEIQQNGERDMKKIPVSQQLGVRKRKKEMKKSEEKRKERFWVKTPRTPVPAFVLPFPTLHQHDVQQVPKKKKH